MTDPLTIQRDGIAILNARLDGDEQRIADLCAITPVTAAELAGFYGGLVEGAVRGDLIRREDVSELALLLAAREGPL